MTDQLIPVPFYDDTMVLVNHNDQPFVAMKPIVENMGLCWKTQHRKLTSRFDSVMVIMTTTGGDGKKYEMVCLPLRKVPAFLYLINPSKVSPELREKVIRYQNECDNALWDYWTQGGNQNQSTNIAQFISLNRLANTLLNQLQRERNPELRQYIHMQLDNVSKKLGIQPPALENIGYGTGHDDQAILDEFWEAFESLQVQIGVTLNHARSPELLAINMPELRMAAKANKYQLPDIGTLRRVLKTSHQPQFLEIKAVNSSTKYHAVKCWVFHVQHSLLENTMH